VLFKNLKGKVQKNGLAPQLLELRRLPRGKVSYSPSRNRQCHMYTVMERRDSRSLTLKRVFLR
jgi:Acetyl-CoA carboxylase, central region